MAVTLTTGKTFANGEKVTPAKLNQAVNSATVNGLGTMAEQNANAVAITGGNAILDIAELNKLKLDVETGYTTSGAIALAMDGKSNANIGLAGNATFSIAGQQSSYVMVLNIKNTTAGRITLSWPAWSVSGAPLPRSLEAGQCFTVRLEAYGTNVADIYASAVAVPSSTNSNLSSSSGVTHTGSLGGDLVFNTTNAPTVDLTPGTWLLVGGVAARTNDNTDQVWAQFWNSTDGSAFGGGPAVESNVGALTRKTLPVMGVITVTSTKTIYFKLFRAGSSTLDVGNAAGPAGFIQALRLC